LLLRNTILQLLVFPERFSFRRYHKSFVGRGLPRRSSCLKFAFFGHLNLPAPASSKQGFRISDFEFVILVAATGRARNNGRFLLPVNPNIPFGFRKALI
jgi:hypothetical protein